MYLQYSYFDFVNLDCGRAVDVALCTDFVFQHLCFNLVNLDGGRELNIYIVAMLSQTFLNVIRTLVHRCRHAQ